MLHVCLRTNMTDVYTKSLALWNAEPVRTFYIDSCSNGTQWKQYKNLSQIDFVQKQRPQMRWYLSGMERQQIKVGLQKLPSECSFIVKVTGKYHSSKLVPFLRNISNSTLAVLQSFGRAYGGWHSELFAIERRFYSNMISTWTDGRNTEKFIGNIKLIIEQLSPDRLSYFPALPLSFRVMRNGDGRVMTSL